MRSISTKSKNDSFRRWPVIWPIALLPVLIFIAYWPAVHAGFIWDDDAYVTNNPLLSSPDGWRDIWFSAERQSQFFPLVFSVFRLEYSLWHLNPVGYHLVNIFLHAVNALLVWAVLKKLAVPGAWIAAALFALHPVQVESVAWITELKNVQSTFFYLLALLAWMRLDQDRQASKSAFYWLSLLFYVLALLSKTVACTLPAALLLVSWMQNGKVDRRQIIQVIPFIILGLMAGTISIWWESYLGNYQHDVGQRLTFIQRILVAAHTLWFYVVKLVWPVNLTFSYPHWQVGANNPLNYLWLAGCGAVAYALWHWRNALDRRLTVGVIFFVATLSPLLGFIPLYTFRYSYVADHYQYLACVGLFAPAATLLSRVPQFISWSLLAVLAALTWNQTHIYQNQTVLWQDTVAKNPASWMAYNNLGTIFRDNGQYSEAAAEYQQSIQLNPDYAPSHYNWGIVLFKQGFSDQAINQFQIALKLDPHDARAHYNYAVALAGENQVLEAINEYETAIRLDTQDTEARLNLGILLGQQGKLAAAEAQFRELIRLSPANAEAQNDLGAILRAEGRLDDAASQFRAALRLNPQFALAHANFGAVLLAQGATDAAIAELSEALRLDPNDTSARQNLTQALAKKAAH